MTRLKRMICCICGESTLGRQWWNRDTGFGVCPKCVAGERKRDMSEKDIQSCYGHEGYHFLKEEAA